MADQNVSQGRYRAGVASFDRPTTGLLFSVTFCRHLRNSPWSGSYQQMTAQHHHTVIYLALTSQEKAEILNFRWWIPNFTMLNILLMPPTTQWLPHQMWALPRSPNVGGSCLQSSGGFRTQQLTCCQPQDRDTGTQDRKRTGKRSCLPGLMLPTAAFEMSKKLSPHFCFFLLLSRGATQGRLHRNLPADSFPESPFVNCLLFALLCGQCTVLFVEV